MLPDLSAFDVKTQVVHGIAGAGWIHGVDDRATALAYIAALLLAATFIFSRRDFK